MGKMGEHMTTQQNAKRASRSKDADDFRYDLIPQVALREAARVMKRGAELHGERNWRKGSKFSDVLNHALKHMNQLQMGDTSEDHAAHAMVNLMFLIEYREIHPELNDLLNAEDY